MKKNIFIVSWISLISLLFCACQPAPNPVTQADSGLKVLAVESFIADIAQKVAGNRLKVETLMPTGIDPHTFEPTPHDVAKIAESEVLIVNGAGFEAWLAPVLENAGGKRQVIEAAAGLVSRAAGEVDPHFWLDPIHAIRYVENIRDGLIAADPDGKETYTRNAEAYIAQLKDLDQSIRQQVATIPEARRLLVTNHESFGYFADRYGFKIIGAIVPSVSSGASPSAQQLAQLVDQIKKTQAIAIFLETGANPQLAEQISQETGVKVVTDLYTHSLTAPNGNAPSYIEMMKYNVRVIVEALK